MKGLLLRRRKSPRASWHDYTSSGGYFITICTKNRIHYFGEIINGKMVLNKLGQYCTDHRKSIPTHYPFVTCDEFICMPDHIHGILFIHENPPHENPVGTQFFASESESDVASESESDVASESESDVASEVESDVASEVESDVASEVESDVASESESDVASEVESDVASDIPKRNICQSGSLGSMIRGFKIGVTKYAKINHIPFSRQGRYHDTIIHDHSAYQNISNYIRNNPKNRKKR